VRYVLEGSLLPDGDFIHLNIQLIDAGTGDRLWAERFDLKRSDVQVPNDIVARLSRAIGSKMIDTGARRSEPGVPMAAIRRPGAGSEPTQAPATQPETVCARDAVRLGRLRADPTVDLITRFDRELGCEQLRPQLQRLQDSVGQSK
jgi:hypothetical protein